ncbi:hypothetical protein BC938DRAFT_473355 [Jimgerdemannia flammicorona]|uniref:Uncharacterized protein n=1 Tax=Jimgerdemannia flammicorona TaxID=994334 RepID=A0A433Q446_9FUNG|nr:hypothetical protein BC938DRAFT_473355 [Jimgerdemannia flammicorona]
MTLRKRKHHYICRLIIPQTKTLISTHQPPGGTSNWNATVFLNDLAVLNTTTWQWSIPTISGTPPSVRWGHNADYAFGQMVIAFGENPLSGQDSDIYILDTSTWAWTTTFNPSYSDPTPDPTPVPDPTSTGTLDPSSTATPNSGVTSTVGTYIPPSNFTPVVAIAGGAVGGALIIVGAVGGVLLHLHRRRTADADDMPTVVVHGPRSRSPSRMGRSSTDTYAMRKHLSWSDMPGQPSGANTFLTPPSPVVAYADWATDAYMQATRRASRHYREDSGGSISVPILEGETDREESESPPLDEGVTIDTVEIDVDADEVDPEELYRHLEIQTIAVPKQALFVVNKD